jgi:hypothetical protein
MKLARIIFILSAISLILVSCKKENDIDTEKPVINIDFTGAFPVNCDTIYLGEEFQLKVRFSDNVELGSYGIDIHNNFDHHSHSTEVTECELDPVKEPVNPFGFIDDYDIPDGLSEFETSITIPVPSGNNNGLFDEGDYHFFISVTDKEGWSDQKGLSIKMLQR